MITMGNGKKFNMYKEFTYGWWFNTNQGTKWRCTFGKGCKAFITVDLEGKFVSASGQHTHIPRKYYKTKTGIYVKL